MCLRSISKPRRKHRLIRNSAMIAAALALVVLGSCKKKLADPPENAPPANTQVFEYTVRGIVAQLPGPMNEFAVRHEAIPEFRNPNGSLGMNTMQMEFPLGDNIILAEDITPGDPVEMTFVVEYGDAPRYYAAVVTKLPEDTVLDFSPLEHTPESE